jgi:NAD(P)-dependent dehydrogenase (short-subunit alcohol dehydrogenase family)
MRIEAGRVAVVTGGASGIGYALAAAAADRGLRVVLSDVRADALEAACADEAARIAFDAVTHRRPLAFTHADRVPEVEQRFAAIIAGGRPRE